MKLILRRAVLAVCAFLVVPTVGVTHTGIDPGQTRVIKGLLGALASLHQSAGFAGGRRSRTVDGSIALAPDPPQPVSAIWRKS